MDKRQHILTIAIPTYNRNKKLLRLLDLLKEEIIRLQLSDVVRIIISDNSDNVETEKGIATFKNDTIDLQFYKQKENIGFDRNLLFLYQQCISKYIWFISDDDFPFPDSVNKILSALHTKQPDILLFSFMQPPGSTSRQFDFKEDIQVIQEPRLLIDTVLKCPKISIYVLKKVDFTDSQNKFLTQSIGQGWIFLTLSFSVLERNHNPTIAIISEQLATADEDYKYIWVPTPFLHMHKIAFHPYILKYLPDLHKKLKVDGYIQCIIFSWALKRGILLLDDMDGLTQFINKLEWRLRILLVRPKQFLQLILMKFDLIPAFLIKNRIS
jgi:glycosyltransferase involved in cell wall biosynthesis